MAKRANGEGSVYIRKDGRVVGALSYLDPETGERRRHTVYGRTKTEVKEKMKAVRARVEAGAPPKDATLPLGLFLEQWIATTLAASDRKESTKENYATLTRSLVKPILGNIRLDKLRPTDVERLILTLREEQKASSTIRTTYTVLRQALDVAVRDGLLARNPAVVVRRPKVTRVEARSLSGPEVVTLLEAVRGERLEALVVLLLGGGLRRGEALALAWTDVDLRAGTARVRRTLGRVGKRLVFSEPKTDKSRRVVPLPRQAVDALRDHRTRQGVERLAMGPAWTDHDLVFTTEIGTPLDPRSVLRWFQTTATSAGLAGIGLHTLRHTTATLLLEAGTHVRVAQELLGHSSSEITSDVYSHVTAVTRREAADRIEAALDDER